MPGGQLRRCRHRGGGCHPTIVGCVLVIAAPGQGAQTPGFLRPWLEVEGVRDRLRWWSAVGGLDLIRYGTDADAAEIRDTAVAQPLLVAAGMAATAALWPHGGDAYAVVGAAAGHSVGELTAAAVAGAVTPETAMVLVRERGRAMAEAAAIEATGMTAVLGGDAEAVLATLDKHGLTPANVNGAGQVVAAGTTAQLEALATDPPAGARLRPLAVAGAFHTRHMEPAVAALAAVVAGAPVSDPRTRLLSNADGAVVHNGREVLDRLVRQVSNPVRWDLCMRTLGELGATAVLELPPAGTLVGLLRRALPDVDTLAVKTPADLDAARALIDKHAHLATPEEAPSWRIVVAPVGGTFRAAGVPLGSTLPAGAPVGAVVSRREDQPVTASHGGTVVEWLVEDGDPVSPGQPLLRLHPEAVSA
jgi:[acyl-carrier-protein] S-malonyltransferase